MSGGPLYLKWLSMLCLLMAVFGILVFAIGYKPLSFGRVVTVVLLLAAFAVLQVLYRRMDAGRRG